LFLCFKNILKKLNFLSFSLVSNNFSLIFANIKNNFFKIKKYYPVVFPEKKKDSILKHLKGTHILNFFFYMITSPLRFDERTILLIKKN